MHRCQLVSIKMASHLQLLNVINAFYIRAHHSLLATIQCNTYNFVYDTCLKSKMSTKKKRTFLTIEQRVAAIRLLEKGRSVISIAEEFGCGKTQIQVHK